MTSAFRASYVKNENGAWEGAVKDAKGRVVRLCGHDHECRDYNHSRFYDHTGAALYCAKFMAWEMSGKPENAPHPKGCVGIAKRTALTV